MSQLTTVDKARQSPTKSEQPAARQRKTRQPLSSTWYADLARRHSAQGVNHLERGLLVWSLLKVLAGFCNHVRDSLVRGG